MLPFSYLSGHFLTSDPQHFLESSSHRCGNIVIVTIIAALVKKCVYVLRKLKSQKCEELFNKDSKLTRKLESNNPKYRKIREVGKISFCMLSQK